MVYVEPEYGKKAFNCPACGAYANFHWQEVTISSHGGVQTIGFAGALCAHCERWTLWEKYNERATGLRGYVETARMIFPAKLTSLAPHPDLPEDCKADYEEARKVLADSPRSAAALLRLCIQKLSKELGGKGDNINADIGALVKGGLDPRIQKALDVVRVTGNNAVHPGTMDLSDNEELVHKLFKLVNLIVEEMITKPKEIDALYGELPQSARDAIQKRDAT